MSLNKLTTAEMRELAARAYVSLDTLYRFRHATERRRMRANTLRRIERAIAEVRAAKD